MRRLIKKVSFNVGSTVRFKNNPYEKGVFTVIKINEDKNYDVYNDSGSYSNIDKDDLVESDSFIVGDKVVFKTHPYDNKNIYEVKDILPNNNYFIENEDNAYTNINGVNLELV